MIKPILSFPYHDPGGKYNKIFQDTLGRMKEVFSEICISITHPTAINNRDFIEFLRKEGCHILENTMESNIGDHYRNALKLASEIDGEKRIFFGFIDRVLFAMNSEYSEQFERDMAMESTEMILFERSEKAWATHPSNYRDIEQAANKLGKYLIGTEIELATCGFCVNSSSAKTMLSQSFENSYSAGSEWILCAYLNGIKPLIQKTDWLSWEDPFIEDKPAADLKKNREADTQENIKRLEMNIQIINVLAQRRFYKLLESPGD